MRSEPSAIFLQNVLLDEKFRVNMKSFESTFCENGFIVWIYSYTGTSECILHDLFSDLIFES